jgi:hypothetical protein
VVIYVALGSTACSYGLAILGSTIGQPSWYKSLNLAPAGTPGYGRTANLIGAFNGVSSAGACIGAIYNSWSADALSRKHTIQVSDVNQNQCEGSRAKREEDTRCCDQAWLCLPLEAVLIDALLVPSAD